MKTKAIADQLNRLEKLIHGRNLAEARGRVKGVVGEALKAVYAQVRGHASPAVMRRLLELEIEIGGENGDFKAFDNGQLIGLFDRGGVFGELEKQIERGTILSQAVDFSAVGRWLDATDQIDEASIIAGLHFINAWLRILALESGLSEPTADAKAARFDAFESIQEATISSPVPGTPFNEPVSGMTFVFVPGGTYPMGDAFDQGVEDEKPVHDVTLSPFYMAVHPVTQAQWKRLMAENPSNFQGDDHPVEQVTLADVTGFIDRLNEATPQHWRFDLPTEAQWEYAARSGGQAELYAGGQDPDAVAWFEANAVGGTAAVGRKAPNGLGIYDMSGNVWEWCRDIYHPTAYRQHGKIDPVCSKGGTDRVIRGGGWHLDAWSARCSRRFRFDPELFGPALGFRVVMVVDEKAG